jgi:aubergine-like protein
MIRDPIQQPVDLKDWIFVYTSKGARDDDAVDDFIDMLQKSCATFGIKFAKPYYLVMKDWRAGEWDKAIRDEVANGTKPPDMIFTWIPEKEKGNLYKPIKRLCYKDLGIPHQNALANKFYNSKNKMSHASKIGM